MNKKILMLVLFVLLILSALIGIHLYTKKYSDITVVYEANEQGRFRNTKEISEEVFDNFGNLTHYKYKPQSGVSLFENSITVNYTHKFNYVDNITLINTSMIYDNDTAHPVNNTYKISPLEINSEQCIIFETYTDENLLIEEIVCKKLNKTINYSNIFSLLDINFNGYICLSYNPCPTNFQVHLPLLNVGNIMYIKYHDNGGNINYYYDSNDRLLNYSSQVETVHCMYKKINSKKYICYYLSKNNENYTLQTAIDFLEDNKIIKREILNSKQLSFEDYNKQLPKFSEYLEKNKIHY